MTLLSEKQEKNKKKTRKKQEKNKKKTRKKQEKNKKKTRKKQKINHQRDLIEKQSLTYFQTVRQGYYNYLTHYSSGINKLILNGSDPIQSNVQKIMKYLGEI